MEAQTLIREILKDKHITQYVLADRMERPFNTVRNMLARESMNVTTFSSMADALDCDVVLIDRQTGKIYR